MTTIKHQIQDRVQVKKEVRKIKNLPTVPGIVAKISRMVENPETSAAEVGRLISQDQVLSAKVLRMANSAFFGMSRKISSISQALVILGFEVVKGLVLTSSVFDMIQKSMAGLWEHSIGCAAASGAVATLLGREDAEEILVAGLLHDLGKVVLALNLPEEMRLITSKVASGDILFYEAENQLLDFDHSELGQWLAEHWNLPESLAEPMRLHHRPEKAILKPECTAIVHIADIIIRAKGFGNGGDMLVPPISMPAWELLGLKKTYFLPILEILEPKLSSLVDITSIT
ncbi:MAG: HDOD domain-containing protein [Deltaproteobacteria bacterium]|jgi:putative nucleotidyltransferase with HDIG domain|nr:HDOD domain-containing protein [Deltaproteobacteria bacterium]